jgi:hypothetical protein
MHAYIHTKKITRVQITNQSLHSTYIRHACATYTPTTRQCTQSADQSLHRTLTLLGFGYITFDTLWLLSDPAIVKSPKVVLMHHVATLLVLLDPLREHFCPCIIILCKSPEVILMHPRCNLACAAESFAHAILLPVVLSLMHAIRWFHGHQMAFL